MRERDLEHTRHRTTTSHRVRQPALDLAVLRWCGALFTLVSSSCSHHVKLVAPDASPASAYECPGDQPCRPAAVLDDARLNQSGTAFIRLPRECHGHFQQVVILDADSDTPTVVATCAARENPVVETMVSNPAEVADGPIGEM